MNFIKRYTLMRGTRHCWQRKTAVMTGLTLLLITSAAGTMAALDALMSHNALTKFSFSTASLKERAMKAEAQVRELDAVLNGKVKMLDKAGKYGKVAVCEWQTVELVERVQN